MAPTKESRRKDLQKAQARNTKSLPKKSLYRQRAHANPLSDHKLSYPQNPALMDWSPYYSGFVDLDLVKKRQKPASTAAQLRSNVTVVDIGCGFGGLLVSLGPNLPNELLLGLEIRAQVAEFAQDRIQALRNQGDDPSLYQNIACLRANAMKFLPNFFRKSQLKKIFLCFPDPHFKAKKHKARIISSTLISEYAYCMEQGGILYTITDVEDLHNWIVTHFADHPSFQKLPEEEMALDPCVLAMQSDTEEGRKVDRNHGPKFSACFRRAPDPVWSNT